LFLQKPKNPSRAEYIKISSQYQCLFNTYAVFAYTNPTFTTVPEQNRLLFKYTVKCAILCHSKSTLWHSY